MQFESRGSRQAVLDLRHYVAPDPESEPRPSGGLTDGVARVTIAGPPRPERGATMSTLFPSRAGSPARFRRHRLNRLFVAAVVTATWLLPSNQASGGEAPRRPNIVILLADDMGYA